MDSSETEKPAKEPKMPPPVTTQEPPSTASATAVSAEWSGLQVLDGRKEGEGMFWTECRECKLLHEYERKFVGMRMVCANCNEGFEAVEVKEIGSVRRGSRVRVRKRVFGEEEVVSEVGFVKEAVGREGLKRVGRGRGGGGLGPKRDICSENKDVGTAVLRRVGREGGEMGGLSVNEKVGGENEVVCRVKFRRVDNVGENLSDSGAKGKVGSENGDAGRAVLKRVGREGCESGAKGKVDSVNEIVGSAKSRRVYKEGGNSVSSVNEIVCCLEARRVDNEGVKLGESDRKGKVGCLSEVLRRAKSKRVEMAVDEGRRGVGGEELRNDRRKRGGNGVAEEPERVSGEMVQEVEKEMTLAEMKMEALKRSKGRKEGRSVKTVEIREEREEEKSRRELALVECGDLEVMTVEDSDFYDFDEDRVERSFKKGQVWAIYDDDDGMPRHYGLIEEVDSVNPFEVKMSWLDLQNDGDERLVTWERMGFHVSCGKFRVARKDTVNLLNIFSHLIECERAARELYRIYPKKGSVWALYDETSLDRDRRHYDIVVLLTSYSEMHGLSIAYLEKVDGFRAVFGRREIGYHAVRWMEKDDIRLFSHQIPARKLTGKELPSFSGDCWELDPASLSQDMLGIT